MKKVEKLDMNLICKLTDNDIGGEYLSLINPNIRISSRGIVIRRDGKIAIFNKSNKNEYKLPGGGSENNESPEETFIREVLEETGCDVDIIEKLGITEEYKCKTNFKQISNIFVGMVKKDNNNLNLTQQEEDEGGKLLWVTPEEGLSLITNCYNKIVESAYEDIYMTKFVVLRDRKILEYYLNIKNSN